MLLLLRRPRNIHRKAVIAASRMDRQLHLLQSSLRALVSGEILRRGLRAARDKRDRRDRR
jgi:hypothetical protein